MNVQVILLIVLVLSSAWAKENKDLIQLRKDVATLVNEKETLQKEIAKAETNLVRTDSLKAVELRRAEERRRRDEKDLERRWEEVRDLEKKLEGVRAEFSSEKMKQAVLANRTENIEARQKSLVGVLVEYCRKLEHLVQKSVPWDRAGRLERIFALRRDLENGNAVAEEGFIRLRSLAAEEARFGDEIVLLNRPVTRNDGEVVNAQLLKIGNQWMAYVDEEEKTYGILERSTEEGKHKWIWRENLSFAERESLRRAVDVKAARRPPQVVTLPLSFDLPPGTLEKSEESK